MRLHSCVALAGALLLGACAAQKPTMNIESPYRDLNTLARGQIVHLATGRLLTEDELYAHLAHYRVVYVGESHDSVDDHAVQLSVLTAINQRFPGRVALGMEMLRRPSQGDVDAFLAGKLTEKEFLRVWQQNWGPRSYPYYRAILLYCKEQGIPVLALNSGKDLDAALRTGSLGELEPEFAERLPEMDLDDPYYKATMAGFFDGHEGGSKHMELFNRIQVLRDETMADTAARFLRSPEGADKRLVIFAGGNHVRYGYGIP
ncbi:MAG: ChaN family lipoprotein, partial [Deferrisomatales bacterium]|nr:ChaN family lipoprotein [Deferrisomatales bacterium]